MSVPFLGDVWSQDLQIKFKAEIIWHISSSTIANHVISKSNTYNIDVNKQLAKHQHTHTQCRSSWTRITKLACFFQLRDPSPRKSSNNQPSTEQSPKNDTNLNFICTWSPNDLYFWRSTPQNKPFSNQNKGHLGSRYIICIITKKITYMTDGLATNHLTHTYISPASPMSP